MLFARFWAHCISELSSKNPCNWTIFLVASGIYRALFQWSQFPRKYSLPQIHTVPATDGGGGGGAAAAAAAAGAGAGGVVIVVLVVAALAPAAPAAAVVATAGDAVASAGAAWTEQDPSSCTVST